MGYAQPLRQPGKGRWNTVSSDDISEIGERFVCDNAPLLFTHIVKLERNADYPERPYFEGADLDTRIIMGTWVDVPDGDIERIAGYAGKKGYLVNKIMAGQVEVKTSRFEQYIAHNNPMTETGVISFPIWNNDNTPKKKGSQRVKLGNLYRMFYPDEKNKGIQPLAYVAVFLNKKLIPYVCLVFEDFPRLREELIKIGAEYGLDLTKEGFESIPCWEDLKGWNSPDEWAAQKMAENPGLKLMKDMWYIPMSKVIDLARVIMIGDPPEISGSYNHCSEDLQKKRLEYLESKSCKRIPLVTDEETVERNCRRSGIYKTTAQFSIRRE